MLTSIGSGVTAICFWVTRAEIVAAEANGFSLLDSEGDTTPRFQEAAKVGAGLIKHQDIFAAPSWAGAQIAIFVSEANYQVCANIPNGDKHLEFSTRGWHRLLWDTNIAVDFIDASVLSETDLTKYKVIVLPFPLSISDSAISKLAAYVNAGGNLICEAGVARLNEFAYANRGEISKTARDLFGAKPTSFTMVREPDNEKRWSPPERTWGEFLDATVLSGANELKGEKTPANVYVQTFDAFNSEPCLYFDGKVAGTVRRYGTGRAWLLGTYVGHNGTAYRNDNTMKFVRTLMKKCGVVPESDGELFVRKRRIDGKEAWIITNPSKHSVTEQLNVGTWAKATDLFDQPVSIEDKKIRLSVDSLDVALVLLSK
jgi:beta-galactosidase